MVTALWVLILLLIAYAGVAIIKEALICVVILVTEVVLGVRSMRREAPKRGRMGF